MEEVIMEPDINNMTLNEYLMHEGRHRDLARNYTSRKSVAPMRNRILAYPDSDEEDEEYSEYDLSVAMQCLMKSDVHDTTHGFTP
ncbi:hypothetical protein Tco_0691982 [Tanacetum coccineum]